MNIKRVLTWIKPTSSQIHLGNYFGAVRPLFDLVQQHDGQVMFMIATMHALTTLHNWSELYQNIVSLAKIYLAMMRSARIWDNELCIFNQADVLAHAQLCRVMQCLTHMWFMERMHAYKDARAKWTSWDVSVGTFCYPILQAVDVLAYDTSYVPVGKDQKQHIEFARDVAQKFNHQYGETFVVPECLVQESVATVPWIDGRKMSKSYNNYIWLLDTDKEIAKKVKRIPTAPISIQEPKNPDRCNVYAIHKLFLSDDQDQQLRMRYTSGWLSYKEVKEELIQYIIEFVTPIRDEYQSIDDVHVQELLHHNADIANKIASKKVQQVYEKVWFIV